MFLAFVRDSPDAKLGMLTLSVGNLSTGELVIKSRMSGELFGLWSLEDA